MVLTVKPPDGKIQLLQDRIFSSSPSRDRLSSASSCSVSARSFRKKLGRNLHRRIGAGARRRLPGEISRRTRSARSNHQPDQRRILDEASLCFGADRFRPTCFRSRFAKFNRSRSTGFRIRLAPQGVTGVAYFEADYLDPARNPPLEIDWQPVIPISRRRAAGSPS